MSTLFEFAALILTFAGVALALLHMIGLGVLILRHEPEENRPDFLPWGYIGVGLLVAFIAYFVGRGLHDGTWGAIKDATGLVVVLVVASGGFGASYEWLTLRAGKTIRWPLPLLLSALLGATIGVAGLNN